MKKLIFFLMIGIAIVVTSCGSGKTTEETTPQTDSTAVQVDSTTVQTDSTVSVK